MARLNCVVRGVGESPFRGGAAPDGRGQAVHEGGERDGRDLEDAADRGENLPPARCARIARRRRERPGLHQRSTCCEPRRQEGRRLISFTDFVTRPLSGRGLSPVQYARPMMVLQEREETMAERLGDGEWTFEVEEDWAKVPDEIALGDCAAVGVDSKDIVYAFNRGEHPIAVFHNDGNLLRTWGEGLFTRPHCEPHGVHMGPDDTIWLTDDGDHTVRKCTLDGKVLMTLGVPGEPKPYMSGEPFHRCTHTALSPRSDLYVSDGYGNARIHKYSPDGKLQVSWASPAPTRANSTSRTTSAATPTAGSMSPTARTTGCRYSTATASSKPSGTICT